MSHTLLIKQKTEISSSRGECICTAGLMSSVHKIFSTIRTKQQFNCNCCNVELKKKPKTMSLNLMQQPPKANDSRHWHPRMRERPRNVTPTACSPSCLSTSSTTTTLAHLYQFFSALNCVT